MKRSFNREPQAFTTGHLKEPASPTKRVQYATQNNSRTGVEKRSSCGFSNQFANQKGSAATYQRSPIISTSYKNVNSGYQLDKTRDSLNLAKLSGAENQSAIHGGGVELSKNSLISSRPGGVQGHAMQPQ